MGNEMKNPENLAILFVLLDTFKVLKILKAVKWV